MANIARAPRNAFAYFDNMNNWLSPRSDLLPYRLLAPDNSPTGLIIHEDNTVANTHYITTPAGIPAPYMSNPVTVSYFLRALNRDWVQIDATRAGVNASVFFDVANGVIGTASASVLAAIIEPMGDNWYRCWISFLVDLIASQCRVFIGEANNDTNFDGLDQDSIGIWRPQLNPGIGPDPHDSIPILSNVNLIPNLDLTAWGVFFGATVDATPIPGPEGALTAYRVNDDGSTANAQIRIATNNISVATHCAYMIVKEGTTAGTTLIVYDTTALAARIRVNYRWAAGVLTVNAIVNGTDAFAVDMGGGWYLIWGTNNNFVPGNNHEIRYYPSESGVTPVSPEYVDVVAGKLIPGVTGPTDVIAQEVPRT